MINPMLPLAYGGYANTYPYNANQKVKVVKVPVAVPVKVEEKKKPMSTGAKIGIGATVATCAAVALDYVFAKGKHVKSIVNKLGGNTATAETIKRKATISKTQIAEYLKEKTSKIKEKDIDLFADLVEGLLDVADVVT